MLFIKKDLRLLQAHSSTPNIKNSEKISESIKNKTENILLWCILHYSGSPPQKGKLECYRKEWQLGSMFKTSKTIFLTSTHHTHRKCKLHGTCCCGTLWKAEIQMSSKRQQANSFINSLMLLFPAQQPKCSFHLRQWLGQCLSEIYC